MTDWAEAQYEGQDWALIRFGTDPWLRDENGDDVNLEAWREEHESDLELCGCGGWEIAAGTYAPVNSDYGIERCDASDLLPGDFEAAEAIAAKLGGNLTIWYYPSPKEKRDAQAA